MPKHSSTMTKKRNPSCCACKKFRRKCEPNCLTAPYFPPGREDDFEKVHRYCGLKHFLRHIDGVQSPELKEIAAETLILRAKVRSNCPVDGCPDTVSYLNQHIRLLEQELSLAKSYLHDYQARSGNVNNNAMAAARGSGSGGFPQQQEEQEHKDFQETVNILPSNCPPLSKEIKKRKQESMSSSSSCLVTNYNQTDPLGGPPASRPFTDVNCQKPSLPTPPFPIPRASMDLNEESNPLTSGFNEGDTSFIRDVPIDVGPGSVILLQNEDMGPMQHQHQLQQEHPSNNDALQSFSSHGKQQQHEKMD